MKTLKYFTICAFIVLGLSACSSDDDNGGGNNTANSFTYDGKTYDLKTGSLDKEEAFESDATDYYIALLTVGVKFDGNGNPQPTNDTFSVVSFDLYSSNTNTFEKGTYNFSEDSEEPFKFFGEFNFKVGINDEDSGEYYEATSGKVEVISNTDPYEFDFNLTLENGKKISGHYKGSLLNEDNYGETGRPAKATSSKREHRFF